MTSNLGRALAACGLILALSSSAGARSADPLSANAPAENRTALRDAIRTSLPALTSDHPASAKPIRAQSPYGKITTIPHARTKRALGAFLGAFGGMLAGGYIGVQLEGDCRCDDPGLKGLVIGAPIGAALGGIAGVLIASR